MNHTMMEVLMHLGLCLVIQLSMEWEVRGKHCSQELRVLDTILGSESKRNTLNLGNNDTFISNQY